MAKEQRLPEEPPTHLLFIGDANNQKKGDKDSCLNTENGSPGGVVQPTDWRAKQRLRFLVVKAGASLSRIISKYLYLHLKRKGGRTEERRGPRTSSPKKS